MSAILEAPDHLARHARSGRPMGIGDCPTCNLIRLGYVVPTAAETPKGAADMATLTREEEVHAANPPSAWTVHKAAERCWQVRDVHGQVLETHPTKRAAEAARTDGWAAREWADRGAWMAGDEGVRARKHWRPFADIVAERERWEARNGKPAPWLR